MSAEPNPFEVLELPPDSTAIDIERAANKLLAMLAVGFAGSATYRSGYETRTRDADLVRWAARELRDPARRAVHAATVVPPLDDEDLPEDPRAPWLDALVSFGWGRR